MTRVAVVLLTAAVVVVFALLFAAAAGTLARLDGATYPAAVMRAATTFATVALFATLVAGFFGAMLDKAAPLQGGHTVTFFRSAK